MDTYLDHNATTPVRPEAAGAIVRALAQHGNASSVHRYGRLVRHTLDEAREAVASLVGAAPANVVFTSGGTEANNQALRGFDGPLLVSAVEHDSVLGARYDTQFVDVDANGVLSLESLREALGRHDGPVLVSVMLANNETGVVQPLRDVVRLAREHGSLVHCDAVQAAGKIDVSFDDLGVDMMSLSAHKLGGPQGVGALVVRDGLDPEPLLRGGGQERRRRAGTENVSGIAGFGLAARLAQDNLEFFAGLAGLRDDLEHRLQAAVPDVVFHGVDGARLPNTSCIGLSGMTAEIQVMQLDLAGVAVSAGSACSSGKVAPSHVLRAMGQDDASAQAAIRVSLGWNSTAQEIDRFVDAWTAMAGRRNSAATSRRSVA
ncbi:MAG: cysteine desulfurase family protein [Alphaproteobacteria bacterium]